MVVDLLRMKHAGAFGTASSIGSDSNKIDSLTGATRDRASLAAANGSSVKVLPSSLAYLPSTEARAGLRESSRVSVRRRATSSVNTTMRAKTDADASTSNLGEKLLGDVAVAASVTFAVSPFLTVIDKAIVQRAAGTHTTAQSCIESVLTIARNPVAYVRSPAFLMMWGVYAATYSTANCLKTAMEHRSHERSGRRRQSLSVDDESGGSSRKRRESDDKSIGTMGVFLGTSVVNSSGSLLKDRAYATMFGAAAGAAPRVPLITYGLWASRDFMVVGSSFILPEKVSRSLVEKTGLDRSDALRVAQFACPVATQFVAGPVQLLGLDFYNRPLSHLSYGEAAVERAIFLWRGAASVIGARVARIAPGYGIGGIGNTYLRDAWREMLIRREVRRLVEFDDGEMGVRKESASRLVELVKNRDAEAKRIEKLTASTYEV